MDSETCLSKGEFCMIFRLSSSNSSHQMVSFSEDVAFSCIQDFSPPCMSSAYDDRVGTTDTRKEKAAIGMQG